MRHLMALLFVVSMGLGAVVLADEAAADKDADAMVAKVNGTVIREKEVAAETKKRVEAQAKRMPEGMELDEGMRGMIRTGVVDMLVEKSLLSQEMAAKKITVEDEQVMAEIAKIAAHQNLTLEQVPEEIAQYGMTMDDLKEQIRLRVQVDKLIAAEMKDKDISDEDIKKFYDDNPQYFQQPAQVRASHILIQVEQGASADEKAAAKAKIADLLKQIRDGADFAALAAVNSSCPSSQRGGDLGAFGRGQMVPAFEQAAYALKEGEVSPIVETQFGYHIIKKTEDMPAKSTPLEEAKSQIKEHLTQQKRSEFWQSYNQKMRDEATIEYSESEKKVRQQAEQMQQMQMMQQMMQQQQQQQQPR